MQALRHFIKSLTNEHKNRLPNGAYFVDIYNLPLHDKKIILSHILELDDYEHAIQNTTRTNVAYQENASYIQSLFANYQDCIYANDMYDSGLQPHQHSDNGEISWI